MLSVIVDQRHDIGNPEREAVKTSAVFSGDTIVGMEEDHNNQAKDIIEDFMIAANGIRVSYLSAHKSPSIRRMVRVPKRWDRIVALAEESDVKLPSEPDVKALEDFLVSSKRADPPPCAKVS